MLARLGSIILALALLFVSTVSSASRVSPMIVDLEPTGSGSVARISLINDGLRDIPYEVQMMRGVTSPEGQLQLIPADDQFLVFPAQTLVESNSQQIFRVQYVGESAIARSEIYYMSVRQIPVAFEEGVSQIQMVINYNVLVNVVPDNARPDPTVNSAQYIVREMSGAASEGEPDEEVSPVEAKGIEVDLGNEGNRYFLAGLSDWTITGTTLEGEEFVRRYEGEEMSQLIGVGVVAPQASRIFFVPTEIPLLNDSIKVLIEP